jgi:hypothetical protein
LQIKSLTFEETVHDNFKEINQTRGGKERQFFYDSFLLEMEYEIDLMKKDLMKNQLSLVPSFSPTPTMVRGNSKPIISLI